MTCRCGGRNKSSVYPSALLLVISRDVNQCRFAGTHPGVRPRRAREVCPTGHETSPQEVSGPVPSDEIQPWHTGEPENTLEHISNNPACIKFPFGFLLCLNPLAPLSRETLLIKRPSSGFCVLYGQTSCWHLIMCTASSPI